MGKDVLILGLSTLDARIGTFSWTHVSEYCVLHFSFMSQWPGIMFYHIVTVNDQLI